MDDEDAFDDSYDFEGAREAETTYNEQIAADLRVGPPALGPPVDEGMDTPAPAVERATRRRSSSGRPLSSAKSKRKVTTSSTPTRASRRTPGQRQASGAATGHVAQMVRQFSDNEEKDAWAMELERGVPAAESAELSLCSESITIDDLDEERRDSLQDWWDYYGREGARHFTAWWRASQDKGKNCVGCRIISKKESNFTANERCSTCGKAKDKRPCIRIFVEKDGQGGTTREVMVLPEPGKGDGQDAFTYWGPAPAVTPAPASASGPASAPAPGAAP